MKAKLMCLKEKLIPPSPPLAAALLLVLLLGWFLMLSPNIIGMADNGDFERVIAPLGLQYKPAGDEDTKYFDYFHKQYSQFEYFNEVAQTGTVFTSQTLFAKLSIVINNLFNRNSNSYDIRFIGILHIIYMAFAIYYLVKYLTFNMGNRPSAYIIALLCVVMFGDITYTAYFNSFYAEGIVLISMIFTMACALLISKGIYSPVHMMILIFINGIILTTSKQQNAPIGILIGIMIVALPFAASVPVIKKRKNILQNVISDKFSKIKQKQEKLEAAGKKSYENLLMLRKKSFRVFSAVLGTLMCFAGIMVYMLIPENFVYINAYHGMTRGALLVSSDPEETLEVFGIDKQYALLKESIYYERYPAIKVDSETLVENFYSKYSFVSLTGYYVTHPDKMLQLLNLAAKSGYEPRPAYTGNYELSAGKMPGAQTNAFTLHSYLKKTIVPKTVGFIIIWVILALALSWRNKGQALIIATCILIGLSQIGVSIITAGDADLSKHIFAYNVAFDLVNCIGFSALIGILGSAFSAKIANKKQKKQIS